MVNLIDLPQARLPSPPATPLVIPRPKQMTVAGKPLRIIATTQIVVADDATPQHKQGAELLRKELNQRFGLNLALVRAGNARQNTNVIVVGEPNGHGPLKRFLAAEQLAPPAKAEGYALVVTPQRALVAGHDRSGTLWGVQTLTQLIAADGSGVQAPGVRITDWPTLGLRAVHLFHGRNALPFHQKLIDRVLSRFKMNALFLQAEQLRWDADPDIAPAWAGRKEQVREEIRYARQRGITVYPLVQSHGHMEWLLHHPPNRPFAEDPQTPYALNVSDPAAVAHLQRIVAEADDLFDAPGFHVGLDEVTMRGRFPFRSAPHPFAELFVGNVRHWHQFFAGRNKTLWMWADMALHPSEVAPSFGTAPTPEDAARIRKELPKDIVLVDWQYGPHATFPSLGLLKSAGFDVVAATWFNPANIQSFAREAARAGARGALQTTWAGYESREDVLETDQRKQFTAFVLAAEYFWNGGAGPAPDDLPYRADEIWSQHWQTPDPQDARVRRGFGVDLSALGTRPLSAWLGRTPARPGLPRGTRRLRDQTQYHLSPGGALLLQGTPASEDASAPLPATREIPLVSRRGDAIIARQAAAVSFLVATAQPVAANTKVGAINITMEGGKTYTLDLVYGSNIAAIGDPRPLPRARIAWRSRAQSGPPLVLRSVVWTNPEPDLPLRTLTITSAGTRAAPALFAVTALE